MLKKLLQVVQENHKEEESQDQPQDRGFVVILFHPFTHTHYQVKGSDPNDNLGH